jgi:peroxiredoxin
MKWTLPLAALLGLFQAAAARDPEPAPEFPKDASWLQSEPLLFSQLKGKVVVLHFWTFGCINCQRNYPVYRRWLEKYKDREVVLIGVHTPELKPEADAGKVAAQAQTHGLKFPIVIDNDARIWRAWRTRYWPTIFLIDHEGVVRHYWEGELHLDQQLDQRFAEGIDVLLKEIKPARNSVPREPAAARP